MKIWVAELKGRALWSCGYWQPTSAVSVIYKLLVFQPHKPDNLIKHDDKTEVRDEEKEDILLASIAQKFQRKQKHTF